MRNFTKLLILISLSLFSIAGHAESVCTIIKQHPDWLKSAKAVSKQYGVPVSVQLAIIKEESNFQGDAQNAHSTATGFAQVLNKSWAVFEKATHQHRSRSNFDAAVTYIGWYAAQVEHRTDINPNNAYKLYLAYHEGIGGYHHLQKHPKPQVTALAKQVAQNAKLYSQKIISCT